MSCDNPRYYARSTTRESLLQITQASNGEDYTIRADRKNPALLHIKHDWPSGRRYWRPMSAGEFQRLPADVRVAVAAKFGEHFK